MELIVNVINIVIVVVNIIVDVITVVNITIIVNVTVIVDINVIANVMLIVSIPLIVILVNFWETRFFHFPLLVVVCRKRKREDAIILVHIYGILCRQLCRMLVFHLCHPRKGGDFSQLSADFRKSYN